jgi:MYXO-CTERM domain-containing protein
MDILQVDQQFLGLYKLSTDTLMWERILAGSVTCVTWTAAGIYVCTTQSEAGYELGFAENADFTLDDADPLDPLLKLNEVKGPLKCCAAGVTNEVCSEQWETTCAALGACDNPIDSTCAPAGDGGGPTSDAGTDAGVPDAGATGNDAGPPPGTDETDDSGCSCRTARRQSNLAWAALPLLGALLLRLRRRRR